MSYIALARKWRPRTFSQLIGQEHISKALINSLNQQRLHHAYLFTGTRGVGKTSVARLLAKALNCEQGIHSEPCLQCQTCLSIEQGRFIDLIEIDGASKTRVEDTREILENVQYTPTNGRFKIYLIDEVHMLSQHSFNALLKTLEEPPEHVKFLLATTDPQKLPITVLSRCLQFNLKPISAGLICEHLRYVLQNEEHTFEEQALPILAKAAQGSMRDALSILDQAIAMSDGLLQAEHVKNILGFTKQDYALRLLKALAEPQAQTLLSISQDIAHEGGDVLYVLEEMLNYLHQISVSQHLPDQHPLMPASADVLTLRAQFSPEDVQLFYQIGIKGMEDIHLAPTLSIGFEMTLMRMYSFKPAPLAPTPPLAYEQADTHTETTINTSPARARTQAEQINPQEQTPSLSKSHEATVATTPAQAEDWTNILPKLKLTGLALNAAKHAELVKREGAEALFRVATGHQSVFTPVIINRIESALTQYFQTKTKLNLIHEDVQNSPAQQIERVQAKQQHDAEAALKNDDFFTQLIHDFSGELIKDSITSQEDNL